MSDHLYPNEYDDPYEIRSSSDPATQITKTIKGLEAMLNQRDQIIAMQNEENKELTTQLSLADNVFKDVKRVARRVIKAYLIQGTHLEVSLIDELLDLYAGEKTDERF